MNAPKAPGSETFIPPSSAWVRFLRSYGPTPNNTNLFDEYITSALGRAKVEPIELSSPMLLDIKTQLLSGAPGSVLIAGTAGDGKTYHCRSIWTTLGGSVQDWAAKSTVKTLQLNDGRKAIFVKDLSELDDSQSDYVLDQLEQSVLNGDDSVCLIIAANHGQILERLRDLGVRQNRNHPLKQTIQDVFLLLGSQPERLAIYDLSRTTHRNSLDEVIKAVAGHPEWNNCLSCPLSSDRRTCPIFENRSRLLGSDDGGRFARRLGDLVEVARFNGWHLPVRDMLALVSNIVLGHKDSKEGLMACSDIGRIQDAQKSDLGSLYGNVFGGNLPRRRAMDRPIFRALNSFGIGEETTNEADGLLVFGKDDEKLSETYSRLVGKDTIYGATQSFTAAQKDYLEGEEDARLEEGAKDFLSRLVYQRRRLFFTLPDNEPDYDFWGMTAFHTAGEYLLLAEALSRKVSVSEISRSKIVRGLNRVMTGLLIENTDKIFIASSGGFTQSKVSVLCDTEAPARRTGGIGMVFKLDSNSHVPSIVISFAPGDEGSVQFNLTPVRFEFICRVSEGALPGSFSNECLEDLLAFKAKLLRKAEMVRESQTYSDDDEPEFIDTALTLNFIEIEKNGHGFSMPVIIRAGL